MQNIQEFLAWEQMSRDTIDVKKVYIDIAEDLVAGILLSQIIYWYLPDQEGKTKLRVEKDGQLWLVKGREDWWEECRISPKQFDRAIAILQKKGLVEKKIFKFNGNPTTHIRLNFDVLIQYLSVFTQRVKTNLPKGEKPNSPLGKNEVDERGKTLTENTTEITNIDYNNNIKADDCKKENATCAEESNAKNVVVEKTVKAQSSKEEAADDCPKKEEATSSKEDIAGKIESVIGQRIAKKMLETIDEESLNRAIQAYEVISKDYQIKNPAGFLIYLAKNNIEPPRPAEGHRAAFNQFEQHDWDPALLERLWEPIG
jgi:hypothetical protein